MVVKQFMKAGTGMHGGLSRMQLSIIISLGAHTAELLCSRLMHYLAGRRPAVAHESQRLTTALLQREVVAACSNHLSLPAAVRHTPLYSIR